MLAVVIILSTSFWAVPDFIRVDPVTTSGPGTGAIETSAKAAIFELGLHVMLSTFAPMLFAYFIAPKV